MASEAAQGVDMGAKRGERRIQILQVLAHMLEEPTPEKITTAALAKRLDVSEAALYRLFASKAQMYEGLIEFIEETVFGLANKIIAEEDDGLVQARAIMTMLLGFAEKNPGMVRVLIGEALVNEHERLQARVNQLHDRLEATVKQSLRIAATQREEGAEAKDAAGVPTADAAAAETRAAEAAGADAAAHREAADAAGADAPDPTAQANLMIAYVVGRWHQYAKSGFKRKPTDLWEKQWSLLA